MLSFSLTPEAWYWSVKGDAGRVYSSAATGYVPVSDPAYVAWGEAGGVPTPALDEADLFAALARNGLPVPGAPRSATGYALLMALTDDQVTALAGAKAKDQRRLSMRGSDHIPEDSPLVARVAPLLKTSPAAWFDAALKPAG